MSRISFKGSCMGNHVEVVAGWDQPLKEFFMNIHRLDAGPLANDVFWSALDHPDSEDKQSTTRLRAKLVELGVTVPLNFWKKVEEREGNVDIKL